ncbi:hypothetical protein BDM02DRAFT_3152838 [Thelephora ganbajun]|uniref:Uncharacterized protein n=1 Tax=Thelephora ganbajun TaxID=370292 RepID=A0ACB6ZWT2_THEGA|nr:hypothetical protein BDM02DRAFT_3152838 [Thelephora ganbajun]
MSATESTSASRSEAHAADIEFFVRRGMTKGYQAMSLVIPPLYTVFILTRRGRGAWHLSRFLRATWIGGVVGLGAGGGFEYIRTAHSDEAAARDRRIRASYDTASIRADDHATIGTILFAMLTPAFFWKQANVANLILGGSGLGSGAGLCYHWVRSLTGDNPPPTMQRPGASEPL